MARLARPQNPPEGSSTPTLLGLLCPRTIQLHDPAFDKQTGYFLARELKTWGQRNRAAAAAQPRGPRLPLELGELDPALVEGLARLAAGSACHIKRRSTHLNVLVRNDSYDR
jgi:hypothetical protein